MKHPYEEENREKNKAETFEETSEENMDEDVNEDMYEADEISDAEMRRGKKKFFAGIGLSCVAFGLIIVGAIFQDKEIPRLDIALISGFFLLAVIGLVLLIKNMHYVMLEEALKMDRKYQSQDLQKLSLSGMNELKQKFLNDKFQQQEDGWLYRKKFSALKDSVSYCIRITEGNDIEKTIEWQLDHIDMDKKKGSNFCLIIFAYMDAVTEEAKEMIKDHGTNMIVSENALDPHRQMTLIMVAVDKITNEGWYMDIGNKHRISLYAHGCRLMKKMFAR